MSKDQLLSFLKETQSNEALCSKMKSIASHSELVEFAKQSGFVFSVADLEDAEKAGRQALSEDQLEEVSGGGYAGGGAVSDAIGKAEAWTTNTYSDAMTNVYKFFNGL